MLQHGAHDIDLLALEDRAQLLLVDPGAGGGYRGHPGDQGVEVGGSLDRQPRPIVEQRPAHALEGAVAALLDAAHLVDREAGMPDDVELVEGDTGVGQVLAATLDERRRLVDAHRADLLGVTAAAGQLARPSLDGLDAATLGHRQHPALDRVGGQGDVVMAAGARGLVNGEFVHGGEIRLRQAQLDVTLPDRGHPVPTLADQPRRGGEGHLLALHQTPGPRTAG